MNLFSVLCQNFSQTTLRSLRFRSAWAMGLLLGTVGAIGLGQPAMAAENVRLIFNAEEATLTLSDLERFAQTGQIPSQLQTFFDTTGQLPANISRLLAEQIRVPNFVDEFLASRSGEFVLIQLDQVIQGEQGLQALRSSVETSANDDIISVLEVLRNYRANTITVNVNNLEGTYNQVANFVERVLPALEVAQGFLEDLICDCPTAQAGGTPVASTCITTPTAATPVATAAAPSANLPKPIAPKALPAEARP